VVSITAINSGTTFNVIPQTADIQGTIRTYNPNIRKMVLERFTEIVEHTSTALNCAAEIHTESVTPAVINDVELSERVQKVAKTHLPEATLDSSEQTMGSEDMAYMMDEIPGCYFFIGSANSDKGLDAKHHHPRFDFDESALTNGAALMTASIIDILS
jgi:amidohydrolase